jgi:hypothetical protein
MKPINIEGYTSDEILSLPDAQIEAMIFCSNPIVLHVGSAKILGEFKIKGDSLIIELAQIDGGGEGVLPTLGSLAERYAKKKGLKRIEWMVHALNCAKPNLKLRKVMERKGFSVKYIEAIGEVYYLADEV